MLIHNYWDFKNDMQLKFPYVANSLTRKCEALHVKVIRQLYNISKALTYGTRQTSEQMMQLKYNFSLITHS